ncbi:MAG: hypothetical protein Ct9H90mP7_5350 [Candidatus Neomarinimicrobiota bacterium]|nr:MAG: hypothetical protein Ct9H90mP7_5350 [Candidatus Neomarinimicrobiota bacterium]
MDITNQTELELYFADHFDTVLFPYWQICIRAKQTMLEQKGFAK